ncbi:MAG TPA: ubiquitin-like domain-containing protein [Mycobacteriales bacterium]|nr:ubiquitin-like domain-containing protein [Mycobacteriales bacterium]
MRRSPIALVLLAAILASLTAAATAFAVMEKTVRVDVDGHRIAVRTFAGNVAGVLRKAHLTLGPHDTVAPDLAAPVHDGSDVIVRHGRLLHLMVDGESRDVWVTALSVNGALDQLGLNNRDAWLSASRSLAVPRRGLSLQLRLPQHVTVLVDGNRHVADTTAPDVRALLRELHIRLHRLDHVSTPLTRYPTDGLVVSIDRINQRTVTRSLAIPFRTRHVHSSSLYVGDSKIVRYGQPGVRENTYRLTWKNHKLVRRHLTHSRVKRHPVAQVVAVGTKPRPRYAPAADGLNWPALANCESGGNPRAVSGNGMYRGLYQFTLGAWHGVGGSGDPIDASSSEQTYRAQLLYRRSGDGAWPRCGHYLYT